MAHGHADFGDGGNIRTDAEVTLDHVRIRDGDARRGGGVASSGSLVITHSLIDDNVATQSEPVAEGGGIYSSGELTVRDSTIAYNVANSDGGIAVDHDPEGKVPGVTRLQRVTLARDRATDSAPGGLRISGRAGPASAVGVRGERDRGRRSLAPREVPSNCGQARPLTAGGNLADRDDCGFGTVADPRLSAELVEGLGERFRPSTPVQPARRATPHPPSPSPRRIPGRRSSAGWTVPGSRAPRRRPTRRSPRATMCSRSGRSERPRRASRACSVAAPAVQPAPPALPAQTPVPTPAPTPRYGQTIVVRPTGGAVRVRLPGTRPYVDLATIDELPFGASIEAREGRVRLYAVPDATGRTQASFYGGVFRIAQRGRVIELQLRGPKPVCGSGTATASAHKPKKRKKRRTRRLWGSGKGAFRTSGKYSSATVRGTKCWSRTVPQHHHAGRARRGRRARLQTQAHDVLRAGDRYVARRTR